MSENRYLGRYRTSSTRLPHYDYRQAGWYFVTICTRDRQSYFGRVVNSVVETPCLASPSAIPDRVVELTEIGRVAEREWVNTPNMRPDMNLELDEFVIMPNHMHAIVWIGNNRFNASGGNGHTTFGGDGDARHGVSTDSNCPGAQSKNLASIIRGFKSAVTMYALDHGIEFGWQSRFHEHVIRDDRDLERVREYIQANPARWR